VNPPALPPRTARISSGLLAAAYPLLVYVGLHWLEPRWTAACIAFALVLRALVRGWRPSFAELRRLAMPVLLVVCVLGTAVVANDARTLLFVPTLVNLALLVAFAHTLRRGTPMVETFARLQDGELSAAEARYCRTVTAVWCGFFAVNGAVALWLALFAELRLWTLYTGVVSYALMGLLFAVEFVVRSWRFQRYAGSVVEPLFRRIFPPPPG
jgi:uncharacterized membrane protein